MIFYELLLPPYATLRYCSHLPTDEFILSLAVVKYLRCFMDLNCNSRTKYSTSHQNPLKDET